MPSVRHVIIITAALTALAPASAHARPKLATARALWAVASDGSRIRIGEVTGRISVAPAERPSERFGPIRVFAGLDFEARATDDSLIPIYAWGRLAGGILRVARNSRAARIVAWHRRNHWQVARIELGFATFDGVPITTKQVQVEGPVPVLASVDWPAGNAIIVPGKTRICVAPATGCVALVTTEPLAVTTRDNRGGWRELTARSQGLGIHGWVPQRALGHSMPANAAFGGLGGPMSDGCPYHGSPALVAARTPVHLSVGGPVWAHLPDRPDSVWVNDAHPRSDWVELTFARGVQRSYPGSTCSTGWVARSRVTFDVLREGTFTLVRTQRNGRTEIVLRAVPRWLARAGLRVGDIVVASMVAGSAVELSDLDKMRRAVGIGGIFRVLRGPRALELRVPLAPGCRPPGRGQPAQCRPR